MKRLLACWAVLAGVIIGGGACSEPSVGTSEVWTANCGHGGSLSLQLAYTPRSFEEGDAIAWGLGYRDKPDSLTWLYNNGILPEGGHGPTAETYVGWNLDKEELDAGPTYTYTPMPPPVAGRVIVFDPGAGLGPPENAPAGDPPFMNIFLDAGRMSPEVFSAIAQCLGAHRAELNAAMSRLPERIPSKDDQFLHVLRLGGIAYELPPLANPMFRDAVANMRSATTIPANGLFLLYPGRSAAARFAGHDVRVTAVGYGNDADVRLVVDGVEVREPDQRNGPIDARSTVPGVSINLMGWSIDGPVCDHPGGNCGELIEVLHPTSDHAWLLLTNVRASP